MSNEVEDGDKSFNDTNQYAGKRVTVERERVEVIETNGTCLEVNDSGLLLCYIVKGVECTEFIPWTNCKRVLYRESVKAKAVKKP